MALPYINLYIGDLKKDTDLLSPEAFGGYMRLMLFHMHEAKPVRGEVRYNLPQLCRIFGAKDIEQTISIVNEITDPNFQIVDHEPRDDKYFFRNRRMVREGVISQSRREAGKKGAEATNSKNRQNKKVAENFAAANSAAAGATCIPADNTANNSATEGQTYNSNPNGNIGEELGGPGEKETPQGPRIDKGEAVYVVPELLSIFKKHSPRYIYRQQADMPALRQIAETIAQQENITVTSNQDIERIKGIWEPLVVFILGHKLFKNYQISQVEKYFQAIATEFVNTNGGNQASVSGKISTIQTNMSSANAAKDIIKNKYNKEGGAQ